jgi:WD40 repeat protein
MLPPDFIIHNRYRVNAIVDERPGSAVYRGRDDQTGRFVLLAVLPSEGDEAREDLALIAGQIAALQNDALLRLTDHFAEGEQYYLVCDDPGGQDMERVLRARGGPLPEAEVLSKTVWLLGALEYLHGQRPPIYLGDPTPGDLWIGEDGSWRFAPFALARPIGRAPSPYRAPELVEAHAEPTAVGDLYAIGALLYHALTGLPPTTAEQQAAGAPLIAPRALNPAISPLAEQALLRALQLRAVNRYQAAREMRLALETIQMVGGRSPGQRPEMPVTQLAPQEAATPASQPAISIAPPAPQPGIYAAPPAAPASQPGIYAAPPAAYPPPALPDSTVQAGVTQAPRRALPTGCLVAIVTILTLLAIGVCVVVALLLWPGSPLNRWLNIGGIAPFPTVVPPTAAPTAAPLPSAAQASLGPRAITLQNAAQITQTREITGPVFGPVAFSPDDKFLAIGVNDVIALHDGTSLDEVRQLAGHTGSISALAWSPDSKVLASSAIDDKAVRLWDPATGKLIRTLEGHSGWIRSLAYSPDGKLLASGSIDMTVRVWDAASGKSLQTLKGHTDLLGGVVFSPDSKTLASASRDGSVRLWDVATGQERAGFKFQAPLVPNTTTPIWMTGVAFSPDGKTLAAGSIDGIVRLLDTATGKVLHELTGHTGWVVIRGVLFSPDGKTLATAGTDGTIRLWNPATGDSIATLEGHQLQILAITFSADGKRIVSSSDQEGRVLIWDVAAKDTIGSLRVGQGMIETLAFSPDSKLLGAGGFNGVIRLFSADAEGVSRPLEGSVAASQQVLAFLPDGRIVAITARDQISVFSGNDQPGAPLAGLEGKPLSVGVSRSGAVIAAGNDAGQLVVWDTATSTQRQTLHSDLKVIARLALSDDGSLLAAAGLPDDQRNVAIEVWDTTTAAKRQTLVGSRGLITAMAFQPGTTTLAACDLAGALRLWKAQDGQLLQTISAQEDQRYFVGLAFSPDGATLVTGSFTGDIQFWNPATGAQAAKVALVGTGASTLVFSPDGQQIAVAGRDASVRVLELTK